VLCRCWLCAEADGGGAGVCFSGENPEDFKLACGLDKDGKTIASAEDISHSIVRDAATSQLDLCCRIRRARRRGAREFDSALDSERGGDSAAESEFGALLGLLYLDCRSGPRDFTRIGKDILHAIASQAATLLENFRMLEAERESVLLRKELEIAASIQRQMIPQTLPKDSGDRAGGSNGSLHKCWRRFYDVLPLPMALPRLWPMLRKGIPAALLASMVQECFMRR